MHKYLLHQAGLGQGIGRRGDHLGYFRRREWPRRAGPATYATEVAHSSWGGSTVTFSPWDLKDLAPTMPPGSQHQKQMCQKPFPYVAQLSVCKVHKTINKEEWSHKLCWLFCLRRNRLKMHINSSSFSSLWGVSVTKSYLLFKWEKDWPRGQRAELQEIRGKNNKSFPTVFYCPGEWQ